MSNKPQNKSDQPLRRFMPLEMRMAEDQEAQSRTVEGYAALFNVETDMGWYREIIMPGAFDNADLSDVRALFNHDPN